MTALDKLHKLAAEVRQLPKPKNARQYADEILPLKTREERKAALALVPEEFRHIVKFYVASEFARRHRKPLPDLVKGIERSIGKDE